MNTKYIMPTRIVISENTEDISNLLIDKSMQVGFKNTDCAIIKQGGYVVLDFGRELCGGIAMTVRGTTIEYPEYAKCRIVFGESVMEALSTIGVKNAQNAHAVRDEVLSVARMGTLTYGETGFRFVKIEAVYGDLTIKAIKAKPDIKDIEYKGSFESNDERLNKIWQVGAYTVHLNMHEYIWDGVKRDRLVWMGDTHPEMSTVKAVFGYDDCIPNSLDFVKDEFLPTEWMNTFPSYSMWWIINHYDWYMQNGDIDYLMAQTDYIEELTDNIINWIKCDEKKEVEIFVDWSSRADVDAALVGVYAVAYKAMDTVKEIFKLAGNDKMIDKCQSAMEYLKGLNVSVPNQKQIAGLCGYSGFSDVKKINDEILSKEPLKGLSTFVGYYVLISKAMAGDYVGALDIIRNFWGAMLDLGATTFWEDFDIDWVENSARVDEIVPEGKNDIHGDFGKFCYTQFRHSLCHGWASGPTAFLSEKIGGIEILEAGCKKVRVKPELADLEWVKISYPTPYGNINIKAEKKDGKTVFNVTAPKEIEIIE